MTALVYFSYGTAKLLGYPKVEMFANLQLVSLWGFAGVLEFVGGFLLIIGLFSRLAAFILSGEMAVAYFTAHAPHSFHPLLNEGVPAILFCFIFLYLAAAGPGPWSVDASRGKA